MKAYRDEHIATITRNLERAIQSLEDLQEVTGSPRDHVLQDLESALVMLVGCDAMPALRKASNHPTIRELTADWALEERYGIPPRHRAI